MFQNLSNAILEAAGSAVQPLAIAFAVTFGVLVCAMAYGSWMQLSGKIDE